MRWKNSPVQTVKTVGSYMDDGFCLKFVFMFANHLIYQGCTISQTVIAIAI